MRHATALTLVPGLVLTAALAGCGSSSSGGATSGSSPSPSASVTTSASATASPASPAAAAYVHSVCGAIVTYQNHVQSVSTAAAPAVAKAQKTKNFATVEKEVAGVLATAQAGAAGAATRLATVGAPKVPGGAAISATIVQALRNDAAGLRTVQHRLAALKTGKKSSFAKQLATLGTSLNGSISTTTQKLFGTSGLTAAPLKPALATDTNCVQLNTSSQSTSSGSATATAAPTASAAVTP